MPPAAAYESLKGAVEADVCVVGGGIAGCTTALRLSEAGYSVIVLEKAEIGSGASGRNGGQALPGVACGQAKLEQLVGRGDARRIWDVTVEGLRDLRDLIAREHIDCAWTAGHLLAAIKPRHARELDAEMEVLERRYRYTPLKMIEQSALRGLIASERYCRALLDTYAGHLNPLAYVRGLATAATRRGTRIYEQSPMVAFEAGSAVQVRAPNGQVRCRHLVLCGNAALARAVPELNRKILGISTSIIATEPLGEARARALITNNAAVADMNWVLDYFRRTADHRLLFGGRIKYSAAESGERVQRARKRMLRVFPQLADARIEFAWSGTLDITLNRAPHFGRLKPNVYFVQGFSGHGIVLAGVAGRLIAEAVAGTAERLDVFARIPHRNFPGGEALRRPALVLAMLYFRLRDAL